MFTLLYEKLLQADVVFTSFVGKGIEGELHIDIRTYVYAKVTQEQQH